MPRNQRRLAVSRRRLPRRMPAAKYGVSEKQLRGASVHTTGACVFSSNKAHQ